MQDAGYTETKSVALADKPDELIMEKKQGMKGVTDDEFEVYLSFEQRDEEWRAYMNKRLVRKIDMKLLPFLVLMYLLNFLDRSNLAQARLGTLEEDLNMKSNDYNLATSILFVVRFLFDFFYELL